ncbi:unnamed protein product [Triticum turgidum subsp. durum]|uniref:Uncharacterized protein n=1 Tax=Triticum turgidum subsp. durum TaxID=4567 RepID=A0A9R0VS97_TRITD|nr:unnamed protein product [Triticum turgidum subsp. durum]
MDQQGQTSIDSDDSKMVQLANGLRGELDALHSPQAQVGDKRPPCPIIIAKVRDQTRNVDNGEYDPDHVAIGPYNYTRPQSKSPHLAMEHDKLMSLDMVITAAKARRPGMTVEVDVYVKELAHLEESVRNCYGNTFPDMTSEQFVRMLLLDGCYILSRLVNLQLGAQAMDDAAGTANAGVLSASRAEALAVVRDVFYLAENQIPFFVLAKIGELTGLDGNDRVITQIAKYALDLIRRQKYAVADLVTVPTDPGNLLHLLHMHLKPVAPTISSTTTASGADPEPVRRWRSATEYYFAGVMFKRRDMSETGHTRCILDVKLSSGSGTLEVPCLDIDAETWRLLRNLMELEQRNRETVGSHVTAYCVFMSQVACTTKDVELLTKRGVIVHGQGNNDEVARCFTDLCKGIMFDPNDPRCNYLRGTCCKLEKRFLSNPQRWMAWLRRKYFNNPWLAVGLLAAAIGLLCAIVQAVYSVLSYKNG